MAQTSYISIPPELVDDFYKNIQSGDRFTLSKIITKPPLISVKKKKGLTARSYLPIVAAAWNVLTNAQKLAWTNAGAEMGLNGYRLFVADKSARIINDLAGNATPSLLHQSWFGNLKIEAPSDEIKIIKLHPRTYYVSQKVIGKKRMFAPVLITEDLAIEFKISLSYRAELSAVAETYFANFYARFWHSYQGADRYSEFIVPLDL